MDRPIFRTPLCQMLGIEYPILLAGMGSRGKATPPELVAAVSEAGGMGFIGGSGLAPEEIRRVIREVRKLTDKPFGVDLLLPAKLAEAPKTRSEVRKQLEVSFPKHVEFARNLRKSAGLPEVSVENEVVVSETATADGGNDAERGEGRSIILDQVDVVIDERVAVFAAGLGDPSWVVPRAHAVGMKVFGLAGSVKNAKRQVEAGVDMIVSQGTEAGGHTGQIGSFTLIPQVVDAVSPKPVIAAGGIGDGRGIAAALSLGAIGAWIGTAFLVADECNIPDVCKQQIVDGNADDFVISRVYTGKTARMFKNEIIKKWTESGLDPLPMPYQKVLMDDFNQAATASGRFELHSSPAGQVGGMIKARRPAAEIMRDLIKGSIRELTRLRTGIEARA